MNSDQEVMYKYISKNLLFLATVAPKAVGPIGSVTPDESTLVVYVIDTVTGRILHRMTHHGSQGPVNAVSFPSLTVLYSIRGKEKEKCVCLMSLEIFQCLFVVETE